MSSISNDPFADPPPRPTRASLPVSTSKDPLDSNPTAEGHLTSPNRSSFSANRNSTIAPLDQGVHNRTMSADPHAVAATTSSNNSVTTPTGVNPGSGSGANPHQRTFSSDPLGVESTPDGASATPAPASTGTSQAGGGTAPDAVTTPKKAEKKSGWSFFKTPEEKAQDALKTDQSNARKPIESEEETEFKALKTKWTESMLFIISTKKKYQALLDEVSKEADEAYKYLKELRKKELKATEAEFKAKLKEIKK
jgi:hypothetical protein